MSKILVCDDEKDICEILGMILEMEFDAEVIFAHDGLQALQQYDKHQDIDLILCDFNMPGKNGEDFFLYNIQKRNLPFIFMSGKVDAEIHNLQVKKHNDNNDVIQKPWDDSEMMAKLQSVLVIKKQAS